MFKKFLPLFLLIFSVSSLHAQTVAYVTNGNNTVSVIHTSTNTITATIAVGNGASGVSFSPDGTRAYVVNNGDSSISVIDTASNAVVATVALASGSGPFSASVTPDGQTLYVAETATGNVEVVSTATNSVIASIPVGGIPEAVAITPDGAHAYVGTSSDFVSVIATATNKISAGPIPVNSDQGRGAGAVLIRFGVTPAGGAVYVPGIGTRQVSVISTATNTVSAIVTIPANLVQDVEITPDGSRVYVPDFFNNAVQVIDTATNTVEPTAIPVGLGPIEAAITPDGSLVYVANNHDNTLSVISTATNTVVATVPVPAGAGLITIANLHAPTFVTSSITTNFNGTAIPSGDDLWFSSVAQVSGLGSSPVTISVRHAAISYTLNGTNPTVPVPDADLTFDPSATTATTTFNTSLNRWQTTVPSQGLAGNVFLDGAELMLPNGLPGGVKNVIWTASFSSNRPGITVSWKWAAAAYSSLCGPDLTCLGVKPVDNNQASQYQNSDHAGTPENEKSNLVAGGTGGGGSNFTGGYSGTKSVTPKVVP